MAQRLSPGPANPGVYNLSTKPPGPQLEGAGLTAGGGRTLSLESYLPEMLSLEGPLRTPSQVSRDLRLRPV